MTCMACRFLDQMEEGKIRIIATGSDHYIQFSQPDLVVAATELVFGRAEG